MRARVMRHQLDPPDGFLQPVSILFLVAIFMDSIEAFGFVLSVKWAFDGKITEGTYCIAQGVFVGFYAPKQD